LVNNPPIVLLDEPTEGIDSERATRLITWLGRIAREKLVIVATHDPRVIVASHQALKLSVVSGEHDIPSGSFTGKSLKAGSHTETSDRGGQLKAGYESLEDPALSEY